WRPSLPIGACRALVSVERNLSEDRSPPGGNVKAGELLDAVVDQLCKPGKETTSIQILRSLPALEGLGRLKEDILEDIITVHAPPQRETEPPAHVNPGAPFMDAREVLEVRSVGRVHNISRPCLVETHSTTLLRAKSR